MSCPVCRRDHAGACHRCPHSADVQAGKYTDRPFERSPCSGCMNAPLAPGHKFASHVSLDAGAPARMPAQTAYDHDAGEEAAADRLSGFIVAWCSLPPKTQRVVSLRLLHVCGHSRHTYAAIGRALRIFPQDAEARLNRALRDMPVLREAFALKEAKKLRRAMPVTPRGAQQRAPNTTGQRSAAQGEDHAKA